MINVTSDLRLMNKSDLKEIRQFMPFCQIQTNFPLDSLTYFKIGGKARFFCEIKKKDCLVNLLNWCFTQKIKFVMLAGGSNVVIDDRGVDSLVIRYLADKSELLNFENNMVANNCVHVFAEAGIRTAFLVKKTVDWGLTGLESFLGVPGLVSGAVFNNAHYMSDLIGNYITKVEVLSNLHNHTYWLSKEEIDFGYDYSRFQKSKEVILSVVFELKKGDKKEIKEKLERAITYRAKTQPLGQPSSGCIFKNLINNDNLRTIFPQFQNSQFVPAGFIIDQAGLKGHREGDLMVSKKHASFIVNTGKGSSVDLRKLINKIKQTVYDKFAVNLEEEVSWLSESE